MENTNRRIDLRRITRRELLLGLTAGVASVAAAACGTATPAAPTAAPTAAPAQPTKPAPSAGQPTQAPASGTPATAAQTGSPIKIAYVSDMTGVFADYSIPAQFGMQIAIEEINAAGGLLGRQVQTIVRDSKGDPNVGTSEARDVILNQGIDILCGATSGAVTLAMAEVAQQQKIVHLAFPTGTNVLEGKFNHYLFMMGTTADLTSFTVATYLADLPYKNYYTIGLDYVFGHQLRDYAWQRLTKLRPDVKKIDEAWPKVGTEDYTPYVTAIISAKPDAVIAALPGIDDSNFIKAASGFGYFDKVKHVTLIGGNLSTVVPFGKDFPKGVIGGSNYALPYALDKYPVGKTFIDKYNARAGNYKWYLNNAFIAYDAIRMLAKAIEQSKATRGDALITAIENSKIDGGRGTLEMRPATHLLMNPGYVGVTAFTPDYPFAVLDNAKEYRGLDYMLSDQQIEAGWKK